MDNATKMEVQHVFTCCGFDNQHNDDPNMGHPSCDTIEVTTF